MTRKRHMLLLIQLLISLSISSVLFGASAVESPAIYISPDWAHTGDPTSAIGTNFTFSVYTDYDGSDVWGYEFSLTFNSSVLEGAEVVNGDLITEGVGPTMWSVGTFNNTVGMLSLTGNGFFALPPAEPPVTSGPGILANVTFTVVDYGISNIALGDNTRLIGYDSVLGSFNIIDDTMIGHIGDGIFYNIFLGDMTDDTPGVLPDAPDGDVDGFDLGAFADAYGTSFGQPKYNHLGDLTDDSPGVPPDIPDGDIDGFDLGAFADNYGRSYP